jgi:hypothetical protein
MVAQDDDRDIEPELIRELAAELEIELALEYAFDPDLEVDIEIIDGSLVIARDTMPDIRAAIVIEAGHRAPRQPSLDYKHCNENIFDGFEDSDDEWFVSFDETQPIELPDEPTTRWRRLRSWVRKRAA